MNMLEFYSGSETTNDSLRLLVSKLLAKNMNEGSSFNHRVNHR